MPAITNVNELQDIELDLAGDYWLANDIDASGFAWAYLHPFSGVLDGKNHVITNLTITLNAAGTQNALFIQMNTGTVKNLGFEDCAISATSTDGQAVATIIGDNRGTISNCWSTGSFSANAAGVSIGAAAGIAMDNSRLGGEITKCYSTAMITASSNGYTYGAGLVNRNYGIISKSYALGNVSATSTSGTKWVHAGGFIAENGYNLAGYDGTISDCYARGNVTATGGSVAYAGGFIALQDNASSEITNAYSTGIPTADDTDGGFCAVNTAGAITDCYWDTQTSGTAVSDGGTGKTTAQMKTKSTFTNADWDFLIIWAINGITNDGYPFFWAMPPEPPESPRETVAVEDKITLESIRNVEMAAGGRTYVDKEGNFVYKSRYARNA